MKNKLNRLNRIHISAMLALLVGCVSGPPQSAEHPAKERQDTAADNPPEEVKVMRLAYSDFMQEMPSNGTIAAMNRAELRFQTSEIVSRIYVRNGDFVKEGQPIAALEQFKLQNELDKARTDIIRARLELQDVLLMRGYNLDDSLNIPSEVMEVSAVRSGYTQSLNSFRMAQYNLNAAVLRAPFDGIVADLFAKPFNYPPAETFCTVIDNRHPEVIFGVLDSELPLLRIGDRVIVSTFATGSAEVVGRIVEINPSIDEKGMVRIKASIPADARFFEGLNVKVRVSGRRNAT
ncbi:MAG: efflux RND transporter periplasmic adaptor subunit [Bacteroidales bacterium]|nr:efflux RND transporter periplasmic adaptor subunit [Bacteroidales bacterium]